MNRFALFAPLAVFVVLSLFLLKGLDRDPTELPSALIGETFPVFTLPALNKDRMITEQDLKSQVTLVNVWATWCFACRIEHPMLNQLADMGVAIVGLNYTSFFKKRPVWDPLTLATSSGVPTATIVPPPAPPSGPKSTIQSAVLITSKLCSITTTVLP
jgi:thiol-disulfide isomerase/thioredoxin